MGNTSSSERDPNKKQLREWEQELVQREQDLQLREQKLQPPKLHDLWTDSGLSVKKSASPEGDYAATLASRVVLLEQQKHRLEEALEEALRKRDDGLQMPKPLGGRVRRFSLSECPSHMTMMLLDKLMRGATPDMREVLALRDMVLAAANVQRNPQRHATKLQNQMAAKLQSTQGADDEEVRAALVQLLNDQSDADFIAVLNEAPAPERPPLPGMTYAEWLVGQEALSSHTSHASHASRLSQSSQNADDADLPKLPIASFARLSGGGSKLRHRLSEQGQGLKAEQASRRHFVSSQSGNLEHQVLSVPNSPLMPTTPAKHKVLQRSTSRVVRILKAPVDPVLSVLAKVDDWQFDAFELDAVTQGRPLSTLAFSLFNRYGLIAKYNIEEDRLARFLLRLEDNYSYNPYHNRIHAADVLRTLHVITTRGGVGEALDKAQDIAVLATYLAAIIHDFEHKGVNNDFLVKSRDALAITYNDRSPMENHHAAAAWNLLLNEQECMAFSQTSPKVLEVLRKMVVDLVLATDMKQHFTLSSLWNAKIPILLTSAQQQPELADVQDNSLPGSRPSSGRKKAWGDSGSDESPPSKVLGKLVVEDEELRTLVLQTAMKCADLGHLTHRWDVHKKWVEELEEEMWRQGDAEKARGMTVSPLMDRSKAGITKSQQGFFDFVVIPQMKAFCKVFPKCMPMLEQVMSNYNMWVSASAPVPEK